MFNKSRLNANGKQAQKDLVETIDVNSLLTILVSKAIIFIHLRSNTPFVREHNTQYNIETISDILEKVPELFRPLSEGTYLQLIQLKTIKLLAIISLSTI